jgi:hypothetical protein
LLALNEWLEQRCLALWHEVQHPEDKTRTIAEVWADELPHLMALPPPFDGFSRLLWLKRQPTRDIRLAFLACRYS